MKENHTLVLYLPTSLQQYLDVQKLTYERIKVEYSLSAQVIICCLVRVSDCSRLDRKTWSPPPGSTAALPTTQRYVKKDRISYLSSESHPSLTNSTDRATSPSSMEVATTATLCNYLLTLRYGRSPGVVCLCYSNLTSGATARAMYLFPSVSPADSEFPQNDCGSPHSQALP